MTSSNNTFLVTVSIGNYINGAKLSIIDSAFNKLHSVVGQSISVSLPKGLYQIRIDSAGYYQEEYIKIIESRSFSIEMGRYSSIPAHPFKSTHEYYHYPAEQYSKESTYKKENLKRPNYFFFLANYERNLSGSKSPIAEEFGFFNDDRTVDVDLSQSNSLIDQDNGLVIFSGHFEPGLYFFFHRSKDGDARIFPIYIFKNYQTQFFLRYTSVPDFNSCRIFFSERMQFDADDKTYCTFEQLLLAFSNFTQYKSLSDEDHINIRGSAYLKGLVNILHLAVSTEKKQYSEPYSESEILVLPDYKYMKNSMDDSLSNEPPMLSFVMFKYSGNDKANILLTSVMDRVAEFLKYDIFWSSFINLESPKDIAEIMKREMMKPTAIELVTNFVRKMGILSSQKNIFKKEDRKWIKERVLSALSEEDTDLLKTKMNSFMKTRGDTKLIAAKFNIPVTTVLRRYKELKKAYTEMESAEAKLMEQDFFKKNP